MKGTGASSSAVSAVSLTSDRLVLPCIHCPSCLVDLEHPAQLFLSSFPLFLFIPPTSNLFLLYSAGLSISLLSSSLTSSLPPFHLQLSSASTSTLHLTSPHLFSSQLRVFIAESTPFYQTPLHISSQHIYFRLDGETRGSRVAADT